MESLISEKCATIPFPELEEMDKVILEIYDLNDVEIKYAIKHWQKQNEGIRKDEDVGDVIHTFDSLTVKEAAIKYQQAKINTLRDQYRVNVDIKKENLALANLVAALGEFDGIFADEDEGDQIVPELMAVLRITKADKLKRINRIIDTSMQLAQSEDGEIKNQPDFSASFGDGIKQYIKDLLEFINTNGNDGREVVIRICKDVKFAKNVREDDEYPSPLRFLAKLKLEIGADTHLPNKSQNTGFGFGSK